MSSKDGANSHVRSSIVSNSPFDTSLCRVVYQKERPTAKCGPGTLKKWPARHCLAYCKKNCKDFVLTHGEDLSHYEQLCEALHNDAVALREHVCRNFETYEFDLQEVKRFKYFACTGCGYSVPKSKRFQLPSCYCLNGEGLLVETESGSSFWSD